MSYLLARIQKKDLHLYGAQGASGFTKSPYFNAGDESNLGGYYATGAQRVDLLDSLRQESGDEEPPDREDAEGAYRWKAPTLLLGQLHASLK